MNYQLEPHIADKLKEFFTQFDFIDKVMIFGSRAKHNANPKSDIDLCIFSLEMSETEFSKLKFEIDELPILLKIDVVHFENSNDELKENVLRDGKLFFVRKVRLKEICDVQAGGTPSRNKKEYWNGNIKWLKISDIQSKYISETKETITDLGVKNSSTKIFVKGTIVYTIFATLGKVAILEESMATNQAISGIAILNENNIERNFLYFYLISIKNAIIEMGRGVAQNNINLTILKNIEIPLPSLTKQKEIAKTLDKAKELIDLRKESINKLNELSKSIFIDMFGDPVENPMDWDIDTVNSVCSEIVDCINRTAPLSENETEYKMVRTTNVRNYKIIFNETRYVEKDIYDKWVRRLIPQKYDVVFTREAPVGEAGIIITDEKLFLGQRTMLYRPNKNKLNSYYLLYELMGNNINAQINKISSGSTVKHLSVPDCKKFKINLPPIILQNKFATIIEKIEQQKSLYEEELTKLQETFDALLAQSFEG